MEQFNLTTPTSPPPNSSWKVVKIGFNWEGPSIQVSVRGTTGELLHHTYTGDVALTLMRQLNTMDFSTISLHKRILQRLEDDGKLQPGTITGSPD